MKTLTLIRHAKSDWSDHCLSDHDRPLNERGQRSAPALGKALARRSAPPQLLLSSTALRAATTAEYIAAELGIVPSEIVYDKNLYLASAADLLHRLAAIDETTGIGHVMLVAHNPGIADLAHQLAGGEAIGRFVTGAVATIELDIGYWGEIDTGRSRLIDFFSPRDL